MKKKTRYKLKNDLAVAFWISISICLIGTVFSSNLFYNSFFRALTKINEEPIATITFKYKVAQRKFADRVVWDRLRQESPVYNGDTIHTSTASEATIWFSDGNIMELSENTMAQVFLTEDKTFKANLTDGYAYLDASSSNSGMTLETKSVSIEVNSGSSLSASTVDSGNDKAINVQVLTGTAQVSDGSSGEKVTLETGNALSVSQDSDVQAQILQKPYFVMNSPVMNAKYLYHTKEDGAVHFDWTFNNFSDEERRTQEFTLEISDNKEFSNPVYTNKFTDVSSVDVFLQEGLYFWRLTSDITKEISGKFKFIQSLPPDQITPIEDYTFYYRNRKPAVRFIWTESQYATSYQLEIAKDAAFTNTVITQRSNQTSSIISTLSEGEYFWRVIPYFTINKEGLSSYSGINRFVIEKKGDFNEPQLLSPFDAGIVNTETNAKNTTFSWKSEAEAYSYRIVIANNQMLNKPVIAEEVSDNYYVLDNSRNLLKDGKWYWAVKQLDNEGNESVYSSVRSFTSMKGKPEQHVIEPLDNYTVYSSLMKDLKFTWKKKIPANFITKLQISTSSTFDKLIYDEEQKGTSFKGLNLPEGSYFWRIVSESEDAAAVMKTPSRKFTVVGNLAAPKNLEPKERAVARESKPFDFTWDAVDGADYYKFAIYKTSDDSLVYEDLVYDTSVSVDMFHSSKFVDKSNYYYQVIAQSNENPNVCSRRGGQLAKENFYLVKLRPVEILFPKKNAVLDGVEAVINPYQAKWTTVDKVSEAQVVLSKVNGKNRQVVLKVPTDSQMENGYTVAPNTITLDTADGLEPGKYELVVYAKTQDGIDISNTEKNYLGLFTIGEVPPLDAVTNLSVTPENFDLQYLSVKENKRTITVNWNKVKDATSYRVLIQKTGKKNNEIIYSHEEKDTVFEMDFSKMSVEQLKEISKGEFIVVVDALRRIDFDKDGTYDKLIQTGIKSEKTFTTDVPVPGKSTTKGAKKTYGK